MSSPIMEEISNSIEMPNVSSLPETQTGKLNGREVSKLLEISIEMPDVPQHETKAQADLSERKLRQLEKKIIIEENSSEKSSETSIDISDEGTEVSKTDQSPNSDKSSTSSKSFYNSEGSSRNESSKTDEALDIHEKPQDSETMAETQVEGNLGGRKVKKKCCDVTSDTCVKIAVSSFCGALSGGLLITSGVLLFAKDVCQTSNCSVGGGIICFYLGLKFCVATALYTGGGGGGLGGARPGGFGFGPGGFGIGR